MSNLDKEGVFYFWHFVQSKPSSKLKVVIKYLRIYPIAITIVM